MAERKLHLAHREARAQRVDRHADLATEAGGERERRVPRPLGERPLAGQRLPRLEAGPHADEGARRLLGDSKAAALALGKRRHREVGARGEQRRQRSPHVRVAEQERPRRRLPLRERERLPLAAPRQPDDPRAGLLCDDGRPVARAVVGDDHGGLGQLAAERGDRLSDPGLLVARRDEDRRCRAHRSPGLAGAATASIGGRMPSVAVCLRP